MVLRLYVRQVSGSDHPEKDMYDLRLLVVMRKQMKHWIEYLNGWADKMPIFFYLFQYYPIAISIIAFNSVKNNIYILSI